MPIDEARRYPDCFKIVEEIVKPVRERDNREVYRRKWWLFAERAVGLQTQIAGLDRVLARPFTSNTFFFAFIPTHYIFTNALVVVCSKSNAMYAVLNSSIHETWARHWGSSMKLDFRYTPSKCFATFALPFNFEEADGNHPTLEDVGRCYEGKRYEVLKHHNVGLTDALNRFQDANETSSDIQKLRDLYVEMDQAVAVAYGWDDLNLEHGFHETKQGLRFTISEPARREVLQRLLKLNHERYAEEVKQGLHGKKKGRGAKGEGRGKKKAEKKPAAGKLVFGDDDDEGG
jgi:hypothetical protein